MAINNTFREVAIKLAPKQPEMIDYVLEEAPIMELMPFQATTNGINHVYEELLDVEGNGLVDLDGELPNVGANTELKQVNLGILGGTMEVGEDKAKMLGGVGSYFASKLPAVFMKAAGATERSILYNNLRAAAIAARSNTGLVDRLDHAMSAGGSGSTNYSLIVVKWAPGAVQGLYDPNGFGRGMLFDMEPINGGQMYYTKSSEGKTLGYGMRLKSYFGVLTADPRNVASIVNIDISDADPTNWKLPTAMQIDDAIAAVRGATGGNTMILVHPKLKTALNSFKTSIMETTVEVMNLERRFDAWNGIPIVQSYNFLRGTEATVTLS